MLPIVLKCLAPDIIFQLLNKLNRLIFHSALLEKLLSVTLILEHRSNGGQRGHCLVFGMVQANHSENVGNSRCVDTMRL